MGKLSILGAGMASDKSGKKVFLAILLLGILRLTYTVIKETVKILAQIIVYFGLYVPLFYFITGAIMVSMGYFRFDVIDVDSILFYVGLGMCGAVSVVITIKSRQRDSVSSIVKGSAQNIRSAREKVQTRQNSDTPIVAQYHSEDHPELFIEEHTDRFVVYLDNGAELRLLRVEHKPKNDF